MTSERLDAANKGINPLNIQYEKSQIAIVKSRLGISLLLSIGGQTPPPTNK